MSNGSEKATNTIYLISSLLEFSPFHLRKIWWRKWQVRLGTASITSASNLSVQLFQHMFRNQFRIKVMRGKKTISEDEVGEDE